jgi:hypothetical protein
MSETEKSSSESKSKFIYKITGKKIFAVLILILSLSAIYAQGQALQDFITEEKTYNLAGRDIALPENSKVSFANGKTIIEIRQKGIVDIDGVRYPIKKNSKFVFGEDGKLVDGTKYTAGSSDSFEIKNSVHYLPEDSEIRYENGEVNIIIPDGVKLEKFPWQKGEVDNSPVNYKTKENGNFILPNGDIFKPREGDSVGVLNWDSEKRLFNTKRAEVDDFEVGFIAVGGGLVKTHFMFSDGEAHPEFYGAYVSLGSEANGYKVSVGAKGDGTNIRFNPGTRYGGLDIKDTDSFIVQASDGSISIEPGREMPKVTTTGGYKIYTGSYMIGYDGDGNGPYLRKIKNDILQDKTTPPMQIKQFDKNGRLMKWEWEEFVVTRDGITLRKGDNIKHAVIHGLSTSQQEQLQRLKPELQLQYLMSGGDFDSFYKQHEIKIPETSLSVIDASRYKSQELNPKFKESGDISTDVHEDTHFNINAELSRGDWNPGSGGYRAFYLGNGEASLLKKTGLIKGKVGAQPGNYDSRLVSDNKGGYISIPYAVGGREAVVSPGSGATNYIPMEMVDKGNTQNYFGNLFGDRDVLHVFEDDSAFKAGARAAYAYERSGRKNVGDYADASKVHNFNIYDLATGLYVKEKNPGYWNSRDGEQLRGYIKRSVEEGMRLINEPYADDRLTKFRYKADYDINWGPYPSLPERLAIMRTSTTPEATSLRQFAIDTYGSEWTKSVLGFQYSEGRRNR